MPFAAKKKEEEEEEEEEEGDEVRFGSFVFFTRIYSNLFTNAN